MRFSKLSVPALAVAAMAVGGAGLAARQAAASMIYSDTFTTVPASTVDLNGTKPTVDPAGAAWTSPTGDFTTGSGAATPTTNGPAFGANVASLPLSLTPNTLYTYTVTATPTAGTSGDWLALGFGDGAQGAIYNNANDAFVLYRDNGGTQTFAGGVASGTSGGTAATAGLPDTFTLTLNSSTGAVTFADTLGLVTGTTKTLPSVAGVNSVFIGNYQTARGTFSALSVNSTAVPEPATLAIAGLCSAGLLLRRKRKLA